MVGVNRQWLGRKTHLQLYVVPDGFSQKRTHLFEVLVQVEMFQAQQLFASAFFSPA
jgi:hypothetical protein